MRKKSSYRYWWQAGQVIAGFAILCGALISDGASAAIPSRSYQDPSPTQRDVFGSAVAAQGNLLLVGSPGGDTGGTNTGQAHLFDLTTGLLLHTLDSTTPDEYSNFGESVAVDGQLIAVGAPAQTLQHLSQGRVELFSADTGASLRVIDDPHPNAFNDFGFSIAIEGSRILIGAPGTDTLEQSVGQAHLFDAFTGDLLTTFVAPFSSTGAGFGSSVALQGDRVLVGARQDSSQAYLGGQAYLFDAATGQLVSTFADPSPGPRQRFARSVAMDGEFVLISDQNQGLSDPQFGRVHLFDAETGAVLRSFDNPQPERYDNFGWTIALHGDLAVINSRLDITGDLIGEANLFNVRTGQLLGTYSDPDPTFQDSFGAALAMIDGYVVVGALGDDSRGENTGQVHVFAVIPEPSGALLLIAAIVAAPLGLRARSGILAQLVSAKR